MEEIDKERKKTMEEGTILFTIGYEGINFEDYAEEEEFEETFRLREAF